MNTKMTKQDNTIDQIFQDFGSKEFMRPYKQQLLATVLAGVQEAIGELEPTWESSNEAFVIATNRNAVRTEIRKNVERKLKEMFK